MRKEEKAARLGLEQSGDDTDHTRSGRITSVVGPHGLGLPSVPLPC